MKRTIISVVFVALIGACHKAEVPLPADTPALADRACTNLRALKCPEGNGSPGGKSCTDTLVSAYDLRPLPLACWAMAVDVTVARSCRVDNEPESALRCQQ